MGIPPQLKIECEVEKLTSFIDHLKLALEINDGPICLGHFPKELARFHFDYSSADAGKLLVRLEPSDGLISFAAALTTGNWDCRGIEEAAHG